MPSPVVDGSERCGVARPRTRVLIATGQRSRVAGVVSPRREFGATAIALACGTTLCRRRREDSVLGLGRASVALWTALLPDLEPRVACGVIVRAGGERATIVIRSRPETG